MIEFREAGVLFSPAWPSLNKPELLSAVTRDPAELFSFRVSVLNVYKGN